MHCQPELRPGCRGVVILLVLLLMTAVRPPGARAQDHEGEIDLTVDRMVELALSTGYQVQFLNLSVDQTQARLRAERARLRSRVELDISSPDLQSVSETQYNSVLGRNEVVRENSRRWEAQLSVRQPVILFGYPTNGYLSLNNRVYRYLQIGQDDDRDLTHYNRYFLRYTQPLFQPNSLKNSLEVAELDLEDAEIDYYADMVELVVDAADDFYELFETAYDERILESHVARLEEAASVARGLVDADSGRVSDVNQISVELANVREDAQRRASDFRRQISSLRSRLSIPDDVEVRLEPEMDFRPVEVDLDRAISFAIDMTPQLRQLEISRREDEIRLEETAGRNAFRMDLEFTYGREMRDPAFERLWREPTNSYTVEINAYVPLWDWGERDARIESSQISVRRTDLRIEQSESRIRSSVENEVRNVEELQQRVLTMQENLTLAEGISDDALERYGNGVSGVLDLLQTLRRELDTARNALDAYIDWKESLLELQELTFFDFEAGMPVIDRYEITL